MEGVLGKVGLGILFLLIEGNFIWLSFGGGPHAYVAQWAPEYFSGFLGNLWITTGDLMPSHVIMR